MVSASDSLPDLPTAANVRQGAVSILSSVAGSALFGAATFSGYGLRLTLGGAVCAPVLFLGGAALAAPPLYLATTLCGGDASPAVVARRALDAGRDVSTIMAGLALPEAFFSATLHSEPETLVLHLGTIALLGVGGIVALARSSMAAESRSAVKLATLAWSLFACLLGFKLVMLIGDALERLAY